VNYVILLRNNIFHFTDICKFSEQQIRAKPDCQRASPHPTTRYRLQVKRNNFCLLITDHGNENLEPTISWKCSRFPCYSRYLTPGLCCFLLCICSGRHEHSYLTDIAICALWVAACVRSQWTRCTQFVRCGLDFTQIWVIRIVNSFLCPLISLYLKEVRT
jgi:hypothetical protein